MADYTQNEMIRQIFDQHWQEFCDYWAARSKDVSQVENVGYDPDRHTGVLMRLMWQGEKKIVCVSPDDLLYHLSQLNEELRQRCIEGAEAAESAAVYANGQGDYAKTQGDRVDALIDEIAILKARVKEQGDTAEEQGNAAEDQMELVIAWFTPFKSDAESWYSGIVSDVAAWFLSTKEDWNTWFAARKADWNTWYSGTVADWDTWFASTKEDWNTWFAARKSAWQTFFESASQWFDNASDAVSLWAEKENERQSAEAIRQELAEHPPKPSARGYWMFWDFTVTPHNYVESGYSSRGIMDWPVFFWDYETMGIGVITDRDYTRFFIDEEGRFGMLM